MRPKYLTAALNDEVAKRAASDIVATGGFEPVESGPPWNVTRGLAFFRR